MGLLELVRINWLKGLVVAGQDTKRVVAIAPLMIGCVSDRLRRLVAGSTRKARLGPVAVIGDRSRRNEYEYRSKGVRCNLESCYRLKA